MCTLTTPPLPLPPGEHSVDEGWLDHVSELQLHLHSSTEPGVRLEGELKDEEIKIKFSVAEYGQNRVC